MCNTLCKEHTDFKLWIQPQVVQELHTTIAGWFVYLDSEVDIAILMAKLKLKIKDIIKEESRFALISKPIFTSIK